MELSTPNSEWGQKEVSNLTISIYEPDEDCISRLYATVVLDKNISVSYHISSTGEKRIVVETTIMNPVLYNVLLDQNNTYYYSIIAEDVVRTIDGKDQTIRTEYGRFPIAELDWVVNPEADSLTIFEIRFIKNQPYHWTVAI